MHELSVLRGLAVAIERAFPRSPASASSAGVVVERWKRALLGDAGITVSKLVRSDSGGWDALRHGLESVPELVGILVQVGDPPGLALVRHLALYLFLARLLSTDGELMRRRAHCRSRLTLPPRAQPSADLLLRQAHTASQSPADRFHIFSRALKNLVTLYRALPARADALSLSAHDEHAALVRTVLGLADDAAAFGRLGTERQVAAVALGRDVVFEAARTGHETGRLPSLHVIVRPLSLTLRRARLEAWTSLRARRLT